MSYFGESYWGPDYYGSDYWGTVVVPPTPSEFHAYIDARGTTLVGEAFLPRETTLATLASDPFAVDRRSTTLVPDHDPFGVNPRGTTIVSP